MKHSIDHSFSYQGSGDMAWVIVRGWIDLPEEACIFVVHGNGSPLKLDCVTFVRPDVERLFGKASNSRMNGHGFVALFRTSPGGSESFQLITGAHGRITALSHFKPIVVPAFHEFIKQAFFLSPLGKEARDFHIHLSQAVNDIQQAESSSIPHPSREFIGEMPVSPLASLIIRYDGNINSLKTQALVLSESGLLAQQAEIIYLIQGAAAIPGVRQALQELSVFTGLPFSILEYPDFSSLCVMLNDAIERASGNMLFFLDSNYIPEAPGWYEMLNAGLMSNCPIVCGRILNIDGSLALPPRPFIDSCTGFTKWINEPPILPNLSMHPLEQTGAPQHSGFGITRQALRELGGFDCSYLGDAFPFQDLGRRAAKCGLRVCLNTGACFTKLRDVSGENKPQIQAGAQEYDLAIFSSRWPQSVRV